jgi:hypothetical protein
VYRVGAGDLHLDVAVDQILHEHHRVVALVESLRIEVLGQLRQIGGIEVDGDRSVLLRCRELVADLLLQEVVELGVESRESLMRRTILQVSALCQQRYD